MDKGRRKDDVFQQHLRRFKADHGVVFVGVVQEKARVPRRIRKSCPGGGTISWIDYTTAMVNFYYFHLAGRVLPHSGLGSGRL